MTSRRTKRRLGSSPLSSSGSRSATSPPGSSTAPSSTVSQDSPGTGAPSPSEPDPRLADFFAAANVGGSRRATRSDIEVAVAEATRRASSGEWDDASPADLVGLYAICHRMVHGDLPLELGDKAEFRRARRAAMTTIKLLGGPRVAARFVQWTWTREKERREYAEKVGRGPFRMRAGTQFSASTVSDWRAAARRR